MSGTRYADFPELIDFPFGKTKVFCLVAEKQLANSAWGFINKAFPPLSSWIVTGGPLHCAYNVTIRDNVLPHLDDFEWLLFIEGGVTPTYPGVKHWLESPGDLVCAQYPTKNPQAWAERDEFHTGLFRVRPEVFRELSTPPWFYPEYDEDHFALKLCHCWHFADRALAKGFHVRNAGNCGFESQEDRWKSTPELQLHPGPRGLSTSEPPSAL